MLRVARIASALRQPITRTTARSAAWYNKVMKFQEEDKDLPKEDELLDHTNLKEHEAAKAGTEYFYRGPIYGPFGTFENPAIVESEKFERIVGCVGGQDHKHNLTWFMLKKGPKHMCHLCGQVFKLETTYDENAEEHHHGEEEH